MHTKTIANSEFYQNIYETLLLLIINGSIAYQLTLKNVFMFVFNYYYYYYKFF